MGAADVLVRLRHEGFALAPRNGKVVVSPASRLTDDHRALIRQHRDDLLNLLLDPDPRVTCTTCAHYRLHQCRQHRAALLQGSDIAPALAALPQRCPAWTPKGIA